MNELDKGSLHGFANGGPHSRDPGSGEDGPDEDGDARVDRALRESEENYRYTIELSPQIPWTADPNGNVLEVGPRWRELMGTTREEALGLGSADTIHPDDVEGTLQRWSHSIRTGEPLDSTIRLRLKDGSYQWFRTRAAARRDASGQIVRWYGVIENIDEQVTAQLKLQESEENYRHIIELSPQIPWTADAEGNILEIGPRWLELMGMTSEAALGTGWKAALHPDDRESSLADWARAIATGDPLDIRYRLRLRNGTYHWFRVRAAARRDSNGRIMRWYGMAESVQEQVAAESALAERQAKLLESQELSRLIARATNDLIYDWDIDTDRVRWNAVLMTGLGYATDDLVSTGDWWKDRIHPADRKRVLDALSERLDGTGEQFTCEYRFRKGDGSHAYIFERSYIVRDDTGTATRMVGALLDLSERREAEEQLRWSATHDALTRLPNRTLLRERLAKAIRAGERRGRKVGILVLDLDHFKEVNDTLGHDAGDALLKVFAERLQEAVRPADTVARLGGDEMAIVLPGLSDDREAIDIVARIQDRLRETFAYGDRILECRASIGASAFPDHGTSPEELLQNADIALYSAKASGRGRLMIYDAEQRQHLQRRSSMINLARGAVTDGRIVPFYQPKVELGSGRITGFEALLRWRHMSRGIQLPSTISAAFDDLEVAAAMSDQIVDKAIADMRRWHDQGVAFGHVAINASAAEFKRDRFAERLLERLSKADIPTKHLQVEVTETVFFGTSTDYVERALKLLCSEGVKIALDDFGTGFASLTHLKRFPVDLVKIDRSFVHDMQHDPSNAAIVRAVVNLARSLGMETVAEGVETRAQADELHALGCDYGQGFLYARAVSERQVPGLLLNGANALPGRGSARGSS